MKFLPVRALVQDSLSSWALVVDKDARARAGLRACLENRGFAVHAVAGGVEAVDFFRAMSRHIAVVLLDLETSEAEGVDTLTRLKSLKPDVPVCAMVGADDEDCAAELLERGASAVLLKPFDALSLANRWQRLSLCAAE